MNNKGAVALVVFLVVAGFAVAGLVIGKATQHYNDKHITATK